MTLTARDRQDVAMFHDPAPVVPDDGDRAAYARAARMLHAQDARLIGAEGEEQEIPAVLRAGMVQLARLLAADKVVLFAPIGREITTQQAANYLGVSRPTVIKLLDDGKIPFTRPGTHRRIRFEDLVTYRERQHMERMRALDELTREAEEMGGYSVSEETLKKFRTP